MLLSRCPGSPQACFVRRHRRVSSHAAASFPDLAPFVEGLEEPSARAMLSRVELLPVTLDDGVVVETAVARCGPRNGKPLVLLAGFDSSLLEYRRLFPLLEAAGVHAVCLDLLGCGLTTAPPGSSNSPAGRRAHLLAFAAQHLHRPMTLLGSSMGGTNLALFERLSSAHVCRCVAPQGRPRWTLRRQRKGAQSRRASFSSRLKSTWKARPACPARWRSLV